MQGIQRFEYKCLLDNLNKLLLDEQSGLPCEHMENIKLQEEKVKEVYAEYKLALEHLAAVIHRFEEQKILIRRLMSKHKNCRKSLNVKRSFQ